MNESAISRRKLLLAAACAPVAVAVPSAPWNKPAPLGGSPLKVTRLGVGLERDTCDPRLIARAVELGVNHFNYFPLTGFFGAFTKLGEAVRPFRDRIVLACCPYRGSKGRSPGELQEDLELQLRALKLDCIDLWYTTSSQSSEDISDDLLEYLRRAKASGKIRAAAISSHNFAGVAERLLEARGIIDAAMVVCNFATWVDAPPKTDTPRASLPGSSKATIVKVHEAGIGIVAMKPLMGGLEYVPPDRREWAKSLTDESRRNAALMAALKWVLANPHLDTVPVRITGLEQLERNVTAASETLTAGEGQLLAATVERVSPYYCRMCQRCEGSCRQKLPVSDLMRFLMYADGYGNLREARQLFRQLPPTLQAADCRDCVACTVSCPYGVRVRERVSRAQAELS